MHAQSDDPVAENKRLKREKKDLHDYVTLLHRRLENRKRKLTRVNYETVALKERLALKKWQLEHEAANPTAAKAATSELGDEVSGGAGAGAGAGAARGVAGASLSSPQKLPPRPVQKSVGKAAGAVTASGSSVSKASSVINAHLFGSSGSERGKRKSKENTGTGQAGQAEEDEILFGGTAPVVDVTTTVSIVAPAEEEELLFSGTAPIGTATTIEQGAQRVDSQPAPAASMQVHQEDEDSDGSEGSAVIDDD